MSFLLKQRFLPIITILGSTATAIVSSTHSFALEYSILGGANAVHGNGQPGTLFGNVGIFTEVTNALLFLVGALSVLMIIYGGLRYVISGGNSTAVTAAKNTILYAIVGLVVAVLAYAIINYVLTALSGATGSGGVTPTNT